jgi:hypothetical protein
MRQKLKKTTTPLDLMPCAIFKAYIRKVYQKASSMIMASCSSMLPSLKGAISLDKEGSP